MTPPSAFLERVRATIRRYRMFAGGETAVAAVSGGADSMALLLALADLRGEWRLEVHVAHFNHRLRPDADEDARFVAAASRGLGLAYHEGGADVGARASEGRLSLEDAARRLRYDFLTAVAREVPAQVIATGHTLDDQAETVLMRVLRGAGLRGLGGIPPVRPHEGRRLVRPLIATTRATILEDLRARGAAWREDPSNLDETILRNRVRRVLLPVLEEYNPDVRRALARLADAARDDARALDDLAAPQIAALLSGSGDTLRVALEPFRGLPPALQRRVLREAVERVRGNTLSVGFVHLDGARRAALEGRPGAVLELPGGVRIERGRAALSVRVVGSPEAGVSRTGEMDR